MRDQKSLPHTVSLAQLSMDLYINQWLDDFPYSLLNQERVDMLLQCLHDGTEMFHNRLVLGKYEWHSVNSKIVATNVELITVTGS